MSEVLLVKAEEVSSLMVRLLSSTVITGSADKIGSADKVGSAEKVGKVGSANGILEPCNPVSGLRRYED